MEITFVPVRLSYKITFPRTIADCIGVYFWRPSGDYHFPPFGSSPHLRPTVTLQKVSLVPPSVEARQWNIHKHYQRPRITPSSETSMGSWVESERWACWAWIETSASDLYLALTTYEPHVNFKSNVLVGQLKSQVNQPLNIAKWTMFYSFDVMGLVGFGEDFNQLESGLEHYAIRGVHDQIFMIGLLNQIPWLSYPLNALQPLSGGFGLFKIYCNNMVKKCALASSKESFWGRTQRSWSYGADYDIILIEVPKVERRYTAGCDIVASESAIREWSIGSSYSQSPRRGWKCPDIGWQVGNK